MLEFLKNPKTFLMKRTELILVENSVKENFTDVETFPGADQAYDWQLLTSYETSSQVWPRTNQHISLILSQIFYIPNVVRLVQRFISCQGLFRKENNWKCHLKLPFCVLKSKLVSNAFYFFRFCHLICTIYH